MVMHPFIHQIVIDFLIMIIQSNTEPYLRFICEATSKELLNEKIEEVKNLLVTRFGAKM